MDNKLFREKSIKKISSPEQLSDYVKVVTPSVWMLITGIIVFLIGLTLWAASTSINTDIVSCCIVENEDMYAFVKYSDKDVLTKDCVLVIDEQKYAIKRIDFAHPILVADEGNEYVEYVLGCTNSDKLIKVTLDYADGILPDGTYECKILTDSIKPIEFLIQ